VPLRRAGVEEAVAPDALRSAAEHALTRAAGAPLVPGNRARLLLDARENYPEWLAAIDAARRWIHFEMYIFRDDAVGLRFADRLAARARDGVRVRILYDWVGALRKTPARFWQRLVAAGCEVRCVNPPSRASPLAWVNRDHRKLLAVDGRVAFVSGLCIGRAWEGDREHGIEAWRDTGVRLDGPVVADAEAAFASVWASAGDPLPGDEVPVREALAPSGGTLVRLIASTPSSAGLFRYDLMLAALARTSLWLTDAYFIGTPAYVDALRMAARSGVDVRLLVPGASDVAVIAAFSRTMYRPLLEAGVRVFEWNGPMLHAKTAVTDGHVARVGSTNLNAASWFGNWELDVAVEDADFARAMEDSYRSDIERSTEVVLAGHRAVSPGAPLHPRHVRGTPRGGSANRAAAAALRLGGAVGTALSQPRALGESEAFSLAGFGGALLLLALLGLLVPRVLATPLAALFGLLGTSLLLRARRLRRGPDRVGADAAERVQRR
jgi:cardiolipin synthase